MFPVFEFAITLRKYEYVSVLLFVILQLKVAHSEPLLEQHDPGFGRSIYATDVSTGGNNRVYRGNIWIMFSQSRDRENQTVTLDLRSK
jgi:hypothetical protein